MKRALAFILLLTLPGLAAAAEVELQYPFGGADIGNIASVQRGARDFMNYCSACHSLKYLRYERLSDDLGIPKEVVENNLIFTNAKLLEPITTAMSEQQGDQWFGKAPPDLSLFTRYRGPDFVYSYLMTYYLDPSQPTGVNNLTFPQTAMPFPLWQLQGWQKPETTTGPDGQEQITGLKLAVKGSMSPEEYARTVADITNFLAYAGDPTALFRVSLGIKVMIYLFIFAFLAYLLKREFWKDIHH